MEAVYLDTHVVVWLFSKELDKFSIKVIDIIEESELKISPMVVLELEFLHEIGRINYKAETLISSLKKTINLKVCKLSFEEIVLNSLSQNWTRDPFDRLIVANASIDNSVLLTKDRSILKNYNRALF